MKEHIIAVHNIMNYFHISKIKQYLISSLAIIIKVMIFNPIHNYDANDS